MILEVLSEADAVFLDLSLDLEDEFLELTLSGEDVDLADIFGLLGAVVGACGGTASGAVGCSIGDELEVLDLVLIRAVDLNNSSELLIRHSEAQVGQGLSELLGRHLEVSVTVPVLEEALRVKAVTMKPVTEGVHNILS